MPPKRPRAGALLASIGQKGAKINGAQIGNIDYGGWFADVAGQERQELTRIALIGLDGVVGEAALACKRRQPGLALGEQIGFGKCQDFGHAALHSTI